MKVAVFGGTGFLGSYLVDELIRQDHQPALLVRPGSESKIRHRERCTSVSGDISNTQAIRSTLYGCDAAIYAIGILREAPRRGITFEEMHFQGAKRAINWALEEGVKRFILTSANGVKPDGTAYQATKFKAEQYLKTTRLDWTIFRPAVMYGDPRGRMEFCSMVYEQIIKPPLPAPLFHTGLLPFAAGTFVIAPINVRDVAAIYVKSLGMPETHGKTYALCGPDKLEWRSLIKLLARVGGKYKLAVPVPAFGVKAVATVLERLDLAPVTHDQITMLVEGNSCDSAEAFELFKMIPTVFNENSLAYLKNQ